MEKILNQLIENSSPEYKRILRHMHCETPILFAYLQWFYTYNAGVKLGVKSALPCIMELVKKPPEHLDSPVVQSCMSMIKQILTYETCPPAQHKKMPHLPEVLQLTAELYKSDTSDDKDTIRAFCRLGDSHPLMSKAILGVLQATSCTLRDCGMVVILPSC